MIFCMTESNKKTLFLEVSHVLVITYGTCPRKINPLMTVRYRYGTVTFEVLTFSVARSTCICNVDKLLLSSVWSGNLL